MKRALLVLALLLLFFFGYAAAPKGQVLRTTTAMLVSGAKPAPFYQGDVRITVLKLGRDQDNDDLVVLLKAERGREVVFDESHPFIFHHISPAIRTERLVTLRSMIGEAVRVALIHRAAGATDDDDPTLTVYPDTGMPGTVSVDAHVGTNSNSTYAGAHSTADLALGDVQTIQVENSVGDLDTNCANSPNLSYSVLRGVINFNTAGLGSGATISAATCSVKPTSTHFVYKNGNDDYLRLVLNSISSNVTVTTGDYGSIGTATQATADASINSMSTGTYVDFTLTSTGRSNIVKTGVTHFGLRIVQDIDNTAPTIQTHDGSEVNDLCCESGTMKCFKGGSLVFVDSADVSGTTSDPKLVITFTAPRSRRTVIFND